LAGSRQSLRVVPPESFGSRLKHQRLADDLTQAELGDRFRVRQQTIGAWEHGERPQSRHFGELANYLGMSVQELVSLLDSGPERPTDQASMDESAAEPVDTDASTMRLLARSFVQDQQSSPLPSVLAADIYLKFVDYFRTRAIEQ
jgi:transcriptional regulator with XRE-family HTH domain